MQDTILIIDFGSQYTQLIARRIRELNVYCEIHPFNKIPVITDKIKGIILSGSPASVRDENSPQIRTQGLMGKLPLLGICYGAQMIAHQNEGEVIASKIREYGRSNIDTISLDNVLLKGMTLGTQVWMSHADTISWIPDNFELIGSTKDVKVAAYQIKGEDTYGIQFHPEVTHTTEGKILLKNFVVDICKCSQDWTPASFVESTIQSLKQTIGDEKVVLGLSGGVDSTVAATLLHQAIGKNLYCIFVDNGLLRKDEFETVLDSYKHLGLNVTGVNSKDRFLDALEGVSDPETKRKIIGKIFIDIFDEAAHKVSDVKWLGQGTIYPDIIESVSVNGPSQTIKSHHNVGGLPDTMKLKIIEPLKTLFKDEVRRVGAQLGIPKSFLERHPFPGPGLAIRIIGEITRERVRILQEADAIFINGLKEHNLYDSVWQAGAIFLPVQAVGVMGDERTYENVICLRAVTSTDGMTADFSHLPHEFLAKMSSDIINKVKGINRVVYDISSKPPATIEWE